MIPKVVLSDFQDFLLSQKLASEKNVPYLANWVSKFLAFNNRKGQADIGQTVAEFMNFLEAKEDIEDWQIRQAGEAVSLYLNHFKGSEELKTLSVLQYSTRSGLTIDICEKISLLHGAGLVF